MAYLIFDTETTGTPLNYRNPITDLRNFPEAIQVAWQIYSKDGILADEMCELIRPISDPRYFWKVPITDFHIKNEFSQEENELKGVSIEDVLYTYIEKINTQCDKIVAHNIQFDCGVLGTEMIKAGIRRAGMEYDDYTPKGMLKMAFKTDRKPQKICTMFHGMNYLKIPKSKQQHYSDSSSPYKYPNLQELYKALFDCEFLDAHDALADVKACAAVFFELKKRGAIIT